jgi:hypothetical protein
MSDQEKLEKELIDGEYPIKTRIICTHEPANWAYYHGECTCCDILSFTWYKHVGCKDCVSSALECLYCGAHYSQLVIFENGKENLDMYETEPHKFVYPKEERLMDDCHEFVNDLELDELIRLTKYLQTFREN